MADGQVLIESKLDTSGVSEGSKKIKAILEDTSTDAKTKAAKIAAVYRESGEDQSTAMKKAWAIIKKESGDGANQVIDDLQDISKQANSTGNEIESELGSAFSNLATKISGFIATAFAVDELVEFGKEAIELGSDLAEVQNVVDVTFGDASGVIDDFAKSAIKNFGLSELSAKQFASTMGAMLKSIGGFDDSEIVEMSTKLAGLAGDLASFYNLDAQEAFDKLRSGISGETEPLKQLGISLSVANLEAFALAQGITKSYNKMSESEKVLLRYNYLLSAAADAQGDFSRTSDSWANQTRILAEEFNSLKGTLGQGLINVLNPFVTSVNNDLMPVLGGLADEFENLTETFSWEDLFGDVDLGPISDSFGNFAEKCAELSAIIGSGLKWAWDNVLVPLGTWSIEAGLPALLDALGESFSAVAKALEWLAPLADMIWKEFLVPIASWTGGAIVETLEAIAGAFEWLANALSSLDIDSITWFLDAMGRAENYAFTGTINPVSYSESSPYSLEPAAAAYTPATADYTPYTYRMPYLATGAVVPPVSHFSAASKFSGTNEIDLDKLSEKIAVAIAANDRAEAININFTGDLAQLARILKPEIDRENKRMGTSILKGGFL